MSIHDSSLSRLTPLNRVVMNVMPVMPMILPATRPKMMPSATVEPSELASPLNPPIATPAEKKAKIGTQTPADSGRM